MRIIIMMFLGVYNLSPCVAFCLYVGWDSDTWSSHVKI